MDYTRLSSRITGRYKYLQTYAYPGILCMVWLIMMLLNYKDKDPFFLLYTSLWIAALGYGLYTRGKKLYPLGYDQENLYLQQQEQEEIIPLWQIKSVELTNLNGGYKIDFDSRYSGLKHVLFLPSFWYPLNYKKIDEKVALFKQAVWEAKKRRTAEPSSSLLPS